METYHYTSYDFENPSKMEVLMHDILLNWFGEAYIYRKLVNKLALTGSEKILDFGCGDGTGSRAIAKKLNQGGAITCLDTSSFWINKAKQRLQKYPQANFVNQDIREAALEPDSFDVIYICHVLHDIEPEARQDVVNALANVLKPQHSLLIFEPTQPSHGMAISEIRKEMALAGLKEIESEIKRGAFLGIFQKQSA